MCAHTVLVLRAPHHSPMYSHARADPAHGSCWSNRVPEAVTDARYFTSPGPCTVTVPAEPTPLPLDAPPDLLECCARLYHGRRGYMLGDLVKKATAAPNVTRDGASANPYARWADVRAVERRARQPGAVVLPAACRTLPCTRARCTHVSRSALHRLWRRASQPLPRTYHASTCAASFPQRRRTSVATADRPRGVHTQHPILAIFTRSIIR